MCIKTFLNILLRIQWKKLVLKLEYLSAFKSDGESILISWRCWWLFTGFHVYSCLFSSRICQIGKKTTGFIVSGERSLRGWRQACMHTDLCSSAVSWWLFLLWQAHQGPLPICMYLPCASNRVPNGLSAPLILCQNSEVTPFWRTSACHVPTVIERCCFCPSFIHLSHIVHMFRL